MKDYACERIYRDARITSIYEGTTQLQVVAAIRHVTTGTYLGRIKEYENESYAESLLPLKNKLVEMTAKFEQAVEKVTATKDTSIFSRQPRAFSICRIWILTMLDLKNSFRINK